MAETQHNIPNKLEQQRQKRKKHLDWLFFSASIIIAAVVGLGEALVAVYFMGVVSLGAIIAVGIPAFLVNFLLFRSDTFDFLKSFGNNTLFRDKLNKPFTGKTRIFLIFVMGLSLFAGVSCGFLQLNSILTTFGGLFWGLTAAVAITTPPLGLMIVAGTVAFISAIANTALLYANVEKFIKEKEYDKYADVFNQLFSRGKYKKNPIAIYWKLYHGLFAAFGLICAALVYVISLGLYQAQAISVFRHLCHLSVKTSNILTYIVVHGTGQILNGFFYARNMVNAIQTFEGWIKDILVHCYQVAKRLFNNENNQVTNQKEDYTGLSLKQFVKPVLKFTVSTAVFIGLFYCSLKNGVAVGQGAMTEPKSLAWLEALKMPDWLAKKVAFLSMATASASANTFACYSEVKASENTINESKEFVGFAYNSIKNKIGNSCSHNAAMPKMSPV